MRRDINSIAGTTKLAVMASMGLASITLAQPAFYLMGNVGPTTYSNVTGLSYDGKVACGYHNGPLGGAFTWTPPGGRVDTPQVAVFAGISRDGTTVTGAKTNPANGNLELLRRTVSGGIDEYLGIPSGFDAAIGQAVSASGAIVGLAQDTRGHQSPVRWTVTGGLQVLTGPGIGNYTQAFDVSDDGRTVVGNTDDFGGGVQYGFRWQEGVGGARIPNCGSAHAITPDARVIVGTGSIGTTFGAMRWINDVPQYLGTIAGWEAEALDVSDDGDVVIGSIRMGSRNDSFVWTPQTGMMMAKDYFLLNGVPLPTDTRGIQINTVSGDGFSFGGIFGAPSTPQGGGGFVAVVPSPSVFGFFVTMSSVAICRRRR